jgi:hypothetical protein
VQRFPDGHDEHVRVGSSFSATGIPEHPNSLCRFFLIKSVFECLDENMLTRVCDLKLGSKTLLLFASASTSIAMFAFKVAHIQV